MPASGAFNIGSIDKLFTAIAIRQLAAQAKLDLDSALATYWPDYPNAAVATRVTIRQLLMHRAGVGGDVFAAPRMLVERLSGLDYYRYVQGASTPSGKTARSSGTPACFPDAAASPAADIPRRMTSCDSLRPPRS